MTTTQETLVDITQRSQETAAKAFTDWTGSMQDYSSSLITAVPGLPSAREMVNTYFTFAEALLRTGREFATSLIDAGAESAEATRSAAEKASRDATQATQQASEATRAATEKAARATSKASRNGAGK
jgi:hypothetical protein